MGWLLGYTLGSMAASFIVVRLFDYLVGGAVDSATHAARSVVFVDTWAAVTAKSGMRGFTDSAKKLRLRNLVVKNKVDSFTKEK